jgi:PAS domain S-box-containing protein
MGGVHPTTPLPDFADIVDQAPDAILLVDEAGQIVYGNRAVGRLFGIEPAELLGRSVETLMPERYARAYGGYRRAYQQAPRVRAMGDTAAALMGRRDDGSEFPVDIHLAPIGRGAQRWTLAVVRDAAERLRIQESERAAQRAAE